MTNLPAAPEALAALLRANAKGYYPAEAAAELLIRHNHWLHDPSFLGACVDVEHDGHMAWAWIEWANVPAFLEHAACSSSEERMLRIAAELAGTDTGVPLGELLCGLDTRNSQLVLAAIAHTRTDALGAHPGWPQDEPPAGAADVRALCQRWDDAYNQQVPR